jgi:hypothetical protein
MKLKRFLLRYDPPGIGLEVEDEVLHKDLPAASTVTTSKDVYRVVDELIAVEPTLLTKRRHRPALTQLLSRLYQVEVEATDDEEGVKSGNEGGEASGFKESADAAPGFQEGQQVVLINLKQKLQVHNGEMGTLGKVKGDKDKYEVILQRPGQQDEVLKVKGSEHIVPVAPKGTHLAVGTHVTIRGLRNHVELNGCLGRVVECHEESHRFEVRATESGQLFRVKQENLVPIDTSLLPVSTAAAMAGAGSQGAPKANTSPRGKKEPTTVGNETSAASIGMAGGGEGGIDEIFETGSTVQLVGLKTAMCYNGQQAEVLSVDRVRCRYEIKLTDGSVKTIRAENVRLVQGPSKRTPRSKDPRGGGGGSSKAPDRGK